MVSYIHSYRGVSDTKLIREVDRGGNATIQQAVVYAL